MAEAISGKTHLFSTPQGEVWAVTADQGQQNWMFMNYSYYSVYELHLCHMCC